MTMSNVAIKTTTSNEPPRSPVVQQAVRRRAAREAVYAARVAEIEAENAKSGFPYEIEFFGKGPTEDEPAFADVTAILCKGTAKARSLDAARAWVRELVVRLDVAAFIFEVTGTELVMVERIDSRPASGS
jgi:hypothetical protein